MVAMREHGVQRSQGGGQVRRYPGDDVFNAEDHARATMFRAAATRAFVRHRPSLNGTAIVSPPLEVP